MLVSGATAREKKDDHGKSPVWATFRFLFPYRISSRRSSGVERGPRKPEVAGSNPAGGSSFILQAKKLLDSIL